MACNDVNFSSGKAIQTITTYQEQSSGDLVAGALTQYDIVSKTIPLTGCVSTAGKTNKLVGLDVILDNNASVVLAETLSIYVFSEEPKVVTTGVDLVPNSLFSTMDKAYFQNLTAKITLSSAAIETGHTGLLVLTATESQVSNYNVTESDSSTLYAVIVTQTATPSTLASGATLKTRFKFEGVMS